MTIALLTNPTWIFKPLEGLPTENEMLVGGQKGFGPGSLEELTKAESLSGLYRASVMSFDHQHLDDLDGLKKIAMSVHLGDIEISNCKTIFFKLIGDRDQYSQINFYWHLPDFDMNLKTQLEDDTYGVPFSEKVYEKLKVKGFYCHIHRDYCGVGMFFENHQVTIGEVHDGELNFALCKFADKTSFVSFFSKQSDQTLSRSDANLKELYSSDPKYQNNQTLTKKELELWLE